MNDVAAVLINGTSVAKQFAAIAGGGSPATIGPATVATGYRVWVLYYSVIDSVGGTVQLKSSGGTALTGPFTVSTNTGVSEGNGSNPITATLPGETLQLFYTGGTANGTLVYAVAK